MAGGERDPPRDVRNSGLWLAEPLPEQLDQNGRARMLSARGRFCAILQ